MILVSPSTSHRDGTQLFKPRSNLGPNQPENETLPCPSHPLRCCASPVFHRRPRGGCYPSCWSKCGRSNNRSYRHRKLYVTLWLGLSFTTVQSAEAGQVEVSLVIGIVSCGSSACPAPSADLGEILFIGKYQSQGVIGNTLNSFENFTFVVPSDISGQASIQVQHVFLLTPPVSVLRIFGSGCLFGLL